MPEATFCPNCGTARVADARFCASCGNDFGAPDAQVTVGVQTTTGAQPAGDAQSPTQSGHSVTVKTEGLVAAFMKMMGLSVGCGCAVVVVGIIVFILIIWVLVS